MKKFTLIIMAILCTFFACNNGESETSNKNNNTADTIITITCNGKTLDAKLDNNESSKAFAKLLEKSDITLNMHDYGGFEKSGDLGQNITQSDTNFTATPGDFILFLGHIIAIYYGRNTYNFTKLGTIIDASKNDMKSFLSAGKGDVNVTFALKNNKINNQEDLSMNNNNKTLVAYFSATGVTKKIAKSIADATDATLYEILPQTPYSSNDLNWHDTNSRTSKECNNKNFRAPIKKVEVNISDYDTIFIGFPIWWGDAPSVIQTFLESSDFSNKKIALFCTSGSSGIGNNEKLLSKSVSSSAKFIGGKRFSANDLNGAKNWAMSLK